MQPQARCASLHGYVDLARELGLEPAALMAEGGLELTDLATPEKWISAAAVARLLARSAALADCPDFGLRLAERRRLTTLGPLGMVIREEPTLRDVLALLIRYERSYNESLHLDLAEHDSLATVRIWCEVGEPAPTGQALALGLGALHGIISSCLGPAWRPVSICFAQSAPQSLDTFHRLFAATPLRFDHDFTGLVLYTSDLDAPNVLADPSMRTYAQRVLSTEVPLRSGATARRVREQMEFLLPLGRCSVGQVASTLGLDRRTLQRHLDREGASFTTLLHETRVGLAQRHLTRDRYALTEVSEALGFATQSAFSRWFRQQFGTSPRDWRKAQRTG